MRYMLAAGIAAVATACGVTEPEPRSLKIVLLQDVYVVGDGVMEVGGEVMMVNGLAEPVMVYPGCTEDYSGTDKWTGGEWVRVHTSYGYGWPTCTSTTLAPGASAILNFSISLHPINGGWPESRAHIPGKYRLVFGARRVASSGRGFGAVSDPIELRLASGGN